MGELGHLDDGMMGVKKNMSETGTTGAGGHVQRGGIGGGFVIVTSLGGK